MGGRAFKLARPITIDQLYQIWPQIYCALESFGCKNIQATGSTFRKRTMGDIDVVVEHKYNVLLQILIDKFGQQNVFKIGSKTISILWAGWVQVDIIVTDNVNLVAWTHYGPSNLPGVQHSSQFKGTIRHILFSAILYEKTLQRFKCYNDDSWRQCYQFDIEEGIFETFQTKIGTRNNKLKKWKTTKRQLLYCNPQQICDFIFKDFYEYQVEYHDVYTFEELFLILREMKKYSYCKNKEQRHQQIIDSFIRDIEINVRDKPLRIASTQEEAHKVLEQLKIYINS